MKLKLLQKDWPSIKRFCTCNKNFVCLLDDITFPKVLPRESFSGKLAGGRELLFYTPRGGCWGFKKKVKFYGDQTIFV